MLSFLIGIICTLLHRPKKLTLVIIIISNTFTYLDVPLSERETMEPFTQSWWWKLGKDLMGVVFKRLLFGKRVY